MCRGPAVAGCLQQHPGVGRSPPLRPPKQGYCGWASRPSAAPPRAATAPWLCLNPLTPANDQNLEALGKVDVLLVRHGHFDHFADAPALAVMHKVTMYAPGDMNQSAALPGILQPELLPRFNKGGTVTPAPACCRGAPVRMRSSEA